MAGGDDLEENFVLDSDISSSDDDSAAGPDSSCIVSGPTPEHASSENSYSIDGTEEPQPEPKKIKLNWREASSRCAGSLDDQFEIVRIAGVAFEKFFPSSPLPFTMNTVSQEKFVDLSEYGTSESRNAQDLFRCIRSQGFLRCLTVGGCSGLRTIIVTSSATRGMYLVRELKEFDKFLSPLPLFFHGGGRKKEQSQTHEEVIKGDKASVAVCLPSRLKAVMDAGILQLHKVDLVLFDLKQNEKKLNVLSMKDTMMDSLDIVGRCLSEENNHTVLGLI